MQFCSTPNSALIQKEEKKERSSSLRAAFLVTTPPSASENQKDLRNQRSPTTQSEASAPLCHSPGQRILSALLPPLLGNGRDGLIWSRRSRLERSKPGVSLLAGTRSDGKSPAVARLSKTSTQSKWQQTEDALLLRSNRKFPTSK